jgi:hypothetical protein
LEDTEAWWAVQKLTGFHCHCRKVFDDAIAREDTNDNNDNAMETEDSASIPTLVPRNKRKSEDGNGTELTQ